MGARDPRVDAYLARARPFARPILRRLRALVHRACPPASETVKWGMPFFEHHGLLCFMAAFQGHCAFGFWKHRRVLGAAGKGGAMGQLGRLCALSDLPPAATLERLVKRAAALAEAGEPAPRRKARAAPRATGGKARSRKVRKA